MAEQNKSEKSIAVDECIDERNFEQELFDETKKVAVVGFVHGLVRMVPYAVSGDGQTCLESATGMLGNLAVSAVAVGGLTAGGPVGAAAAQLATATAWKGLEKIKGVGKSLGKK